MAMLNNQRVFVISVHAETVQIRRGWPATCSTTKKFLDCVTAFIVFHCSYPSGSAKKCSHLPVDIPWYGYGSIPIDSIDTFLGEWTSIYQLFWRSPGVQCFDTLPDIPWYSHHRWGFSQRKIRPWSAHRWPIPPSAANSWRSSIKGRHL